MDIFLRSQGIIGSSNKAGYLNDMILDDFFPGPLGHVTHLPTSGAIAAPQNRPRYQIISSDARGVVNLHTALASATMFPLMQIFVINEKPGSKLSIQYKLEIVLVSSARYMKKQYHFELTCESVRFDWVNGPESR